MTKYDEQEHERKRRVRKEVLQRRHFLHIQQISAEEQGDIKEADRLWKCLKEGAEDFDEAVDKTAR